MDFDEWEKEHSAEICPHCPKEQKITVTRCRQCIWEAAQKKAFSLYREMGLDKKTVSEIKSEARKQLAKEFFKKFEDEAPDVGLCLSLEFWKWLKKEADRL